jgi:hypothetical protein
MLPTMVAVTALIKPRGGAKNGARRIFLRYEYNSPTAKRIRCSGFFNRPTSLARSSQPHLPIDQSPQPGQIGTFRQHLAGLDQVASDHRRLNRQNQPGFRFCRDQAKGGGGGGDSPRSKASRAALTGIPASQGTPT